MSGVIVERRVRMRFFPPAAALASYVTAIYLNDFELGSGPRIADTLHPEWANLRFIEGDAGVASVGPGELQPVPNCALVGPTCHGTRFESGRMRSWGIGLLPLGWAKFIGASAEDFADKVVDAEADPSLAGLTSLRPLLSDPDGDPQEQAGAINATLMALLDDAPADDPVIIRAHAALADPAVGTVVELAERAGISLRSLDRLSRRAFGFTPKLLLRRQRFLRTLGRVMLDSSRSWSDSLDPQYFDQSHFNRDFVRFMGLTPSAYMAQPHPVLDAAVRGRMAAAGAPMQVLHQPG